MGREAPSTSKSQGRIVPKLKHAFDEVENLGEGVNFDRRLRGGDVTQSIHRSSKDETQDSQCESKRQKRRTERWNGTRNERGKLKKKR